MSAKRKADVDDVKAETKLKKVEDVENDENSPKGDVNADEKSGQTPKKDDGSVAVNELDELAVKSQDSAGVFLICGNMNWDSAGRRSVPKGVKSVGRSIWTPHQFAPLENVRVSLAISGTNAAHSVIVTDKGKAMSWGRNEHGQLGLGDTLRRDEPTLIETLKDETIVGGACGRRHTLLLTDRGQVYAFGDNKLGQCGVGNNQPIIQTPTALKYKGPPIIKVGCGGEFGVILDVKGILHSFGCPEYGQLGHNTDGKYFATANKIAFHLETSPKRIVFFVEKAKDGHINPVAVDEIVDFSVGTSHSVCLDKKKRVFSWGWGGFGRLGHAEQKDELIPRQIKFFETQSTGVKSVHCGSSYSIALNDTGAVYLFGQTKKSGEANMYPKPIQDLGGWSVRSIGCGFTSIVVAADDSVIAWGGSPTFGELGFGEAQKSSTTPKEVKALDDVYISQIVSGQSHTMFIARDKTEEERANISNLPIYNPTS